MIVKDVSPQKIALRAAMMFGKPYRQLVVLQMVGSLTRNQRACMVDMECLAELDLLRATGQVVEFEDQIGLLS